MNHRRKGFTLVELVVSLAILAILIVPVQRLYLQSIKYTVYNTMNIEASNAGASIVALLRNQGSLDLNSPDITRDFTVSEVNATTELRPIKAKTDFVAIVSKITSTEGPFNIPQVDYNLNTGSGKSKANISYARIEMCTNDSTIATYHVSIMEDN